MKRRPVTPPSSMPATKKAKTNVKRRRTSNWKYRQGFENRIVKFPKTLVPYSTTTTLKYCEGAIAINPPVGSANAYVFRATDLYDPNLTGVGHQPTGFDQMMALYRRFVVVGSKIKVIGFSADNETLDSVLGVSIRTDAAVTNVLEEYMEQPLSDWAVVPGGVGGNPYKVMTAFDLAKWSNTNPKDNDLLHGSEASSPGKNWYFHVFYGATGTTDDPGNLKCAVEIEYKVIFFEPKSLAVS